MSRVFGNRNWFVLVPHLAWMFGMVVLWIAILPHFLSSAQHIPANGVMQNHDPMVRISMGLWPGKDFDSYLGHVGPLLGGLVAWLMGGVGVPEMRTALGLVVFASVVSSMAAALWLTGFRGATAWAGGVGLAALLITKLPVDLPMWINTFLAFAKYVFSAIFAGQILPDESLRPLRASVPPLALFAVFFFLSWKKVADRVALRFGLASGIVGIVPFWSPDFAVGVGFGVLTALLLAASISTRPWRALLGASVGGVIGMLWWSLLLTGGRPDLWLDFVLDASARQGWLYGMDFDRRNGWINAIYSRWNYTTTVILIGAVASGLLGRHRKDLRLISFCGLLTAFFAAFVYLSAQGYRPSPVWFQRAGILSGVGVLLAVAERRLPVKTVLSALIWVVFLAGTYAAWLNPALRTSNTQVFVSEAGGRMSPLLASHADAWRAFRPEMERSNLAPESRLVSDYYGLPHLMLGAAPPPRSGHAMHLSGRGRMAWLHWMEQASPAMAATVHPRATGYAAWNMRTQWWLHREIQRNYEIVDQSGFHVAWKRRPEPLVPDGTESPCRIRDRADGIKQILVENVSGDPSERWIHEVYLSWRLEADAMTPPRVGTPRSVRIEDESPGLIWIFGGDVRRSYAMPDSAGGYVVPVQTSGDSPAVLSISPSGVGYRLADVSCFSRRLWRDPTAVLDAAVLRPGDMIDLRFVGVGHTHAKRSWSRMMILEWSREVFDLRPGDRLRIPGLGEVTVVVLAHNGISFDVPLSRETAESLLRAGRVTAEILPREANVLDVLARTRSDMAKPVR